ncbi:MAG: hypothetical protein H7138_19245 [Myxococcales bacterium]|nr:hypothetical protein [Myxococcales bacterium]
MAEPAELSPIELDRLEDALEDLELEPFADEPSAAVRGRLHDYRQILTLSRAALPMVEVPRGLLDNVLAEARAAAELQVVAPVEATMPERTSWWARLRRAALLPGVALATTAALVLIMVDRKDEAPASTIASPAVARGELELANDNEAKSAATPTVDARASEVELEGAPAPEPVAPAAGFAAPPVVAPGSAPLEQQQAADDLGRMEQREQAEKKAKPDDAGPNAAPTAADQETTPRWDIIARGDRARHKMDCDAARSEYKLALGDMDARVRARAHAGLGLCEAAMGDRPAADAAYEQARALDAEIAGFIEAERPRGAGAKPPNAAKSSKKAKAAPPMMDDAFESDEDQQPRKE